LDNRDTRTNIFMILKLKKKMIMARYIYSNVGHFLLVTLDIWRYQNPHYMHYIIQYSTNIAL